MGQLQEAKWRSQRQMKKDDQLALVCETGIWERVGEKSNKNKVGLKSECANIVEAPGMHRPLASSSVQWI